MPVDASSCGPTQKSVAGIATFLAAVQLFAACALGAPAPELRFKEALYSGPVGSFRSARSALRPDQLAHRLATGDLGAPTEGELSGISFRGEEQTWRPLQIDDPALFQAAELRGGLIRLGCDSSSTGVVVLQPNGFSSIVVNGVLHAGDYYSQGRLLVPVEVQEGENVIWCQPGRGRDKQITVEQPPKPVYLTGIDATLPDLLTNESEEKWGAIRIVNASLQAAADLRIEAQVGDSKAIVSVAGAVSPLTVRKVPFRIPDSATNVGDQTVHVVLSAGETVIDETDLVVDVKEPTKNYRRTFLSGIDGSVQYYGVREGNIEPDTKPALFVSTHGAGVKAIGQAGSYKSKDWGHVIAPTNRREFGFDWEDWGRLDALEAVEDAEGRFKTDPARTYLTGHSMGGHGAWYLGATYPSRWASVAPIAGWRSFFSYARSGSKDEPTPMRAIFDRAANPSRTLELVRNHLHHGVFIEHGEQDRTVPVSEARFMREKLAEFHPDFAYLEEPGAGHWYGVDHANLFDYFRRHTKKNVRDIDVLEFRTACPGISSQSHYILLYQQEHPFDFSGVVAKQTIRSRRQRRNDEEIAKRHFDIGTENLSMFRVDLTHCDGLDEVTMKIDDQPIDSLPWPQSDKVWLRKEMGKWMVSGPPADPTVKNPTRYGGFKDAFRNNFVFVVSTQGTEEENRWSFEKACFDSENFYYRGNASIEIIADTSFNPDDYPDRSVILYGNATTNAAWNQLLSDSPVQITRSALTVDGRTLSGDDLGLYMIRPRPDSDVASIGVIGGTGIVGLKSAMPCRYFIAGTGYPDMMAFTPELHNEGVGGIKVAGFFGNDWGVESGSFVWKDAQDKPSAETLTSHQSAQGETKSD